MTKDESKSPVRQVVEHGVGLVVATKTGLPVSGPVRALASRLLGLLRESREERVTAVVEIAGAGRSEELVSAIESAFVQGDPLAQDFVQAARAAADAYEPAAIGPIARLFAQLMSPGDGGIPRWRFRRYLKLLEELAAEELRDLWTLVHGTLDEPKGDFPHDGLQLGLSPSQRDGWMVLRTNHPGTAEDAQRRLGEVQHGPRIFDALVANRLAEDNGGFFIRFEVVLPLASAMPKT